MIAAEKRMSRHGNGDHRFVTRRIGTETIIVPVAGRVADLEAVYTLNELATRIWELLDSPQTAGQIAKLVGADYEAGENEIARDVAEFLEMLEASGLAHAVSDPVR